MKRKVYIFTFTILGLIVGFLIHAFIELVYLQLLMDDFQKYSLGLSWAVWENIHLNGTFLLLSFGGYFLGYRPGKHFWKALYVDKKYSRWFKHPLKSTF